MQYTYNNNRLTTAYEDDSNLTLSKVLYKIFKSLQYAGTINTFEHVIPAEETESNINDLTDYLIRQLDGGNFKSIGKIKIKRKDNLCHTCARVLPNDYITPIYGIKFSCNDVILSVNAHKYIRIDSIKLSSFLQNQLIKEIEKCISTIPVHEMKIDEYNVTVGYISSLNSNSIYIKIKRGNFTDILTDSDLLFWEWVSLTL